MPKFSLPYYCLFSTAKGKEYHIISTDRFGEISIDPPKGNSILQIMVLLPFNTKKYGGNLYGEMYLHTDYSLRDDMNLTARLEKSDKVQFPDKPLAVFRHTACMGKKTHYSNYLNYYTSKNEEATFFIFDNQLYMKLRADYEFEAVPEIDYKTTNCATRCFSLQLSYSTWGGTEYTGEILY